MADVVVRESRAIISLIANVDRSSDVMARPVSSTYERKGASRNAFRAPQK